MGKRVHGARAPFTCAYLAVGLLALAGCGSSNKAATTTEENVPGVSTYKPPPAPVAAAYSVNLSGFGRGLGSKKGSPNGSALALIEINPTTDELCWKFTALHNVEHPTQARLFRVEPVPRLEFYTSSTGIMLGHRYTPSGCIHELPQILGLIESKVQQFYLNIHDAQYPEGAVRGPLAP